MRVVIVSDKIELRRQLVGDLASDRRAVVAVDVASAPAELRREAAAVVVVAIDEPGVLETVRALSNLVDGSFLLAVLGESLPARVAHAAIAAGAHDFVRAPYAVDDLRARVDVHRRMSRWLGTQPRPPVGSPRSVLPTLRAWEYLGEVVLSDLEATVGCPVVIDDGWITLGATVRLATIAMTLPTEHLELCVSVVADSETCQWLGAHLLSDPAASDDSVDDVLRELANVAGGSLKRAALAEGPVLSTGIPVATRAMPGRHSGARSWRLGLADLRALWIVAELRHRANQRVPARKLVEGMIVVDDVRNHAGVLLLPSGTRLTSTTAARLGTMLESTIVEVSA